jgi:hypothetical protein
MYDECLENNRKEENRINRIMKLCFGEERIVLIEKDEMMEMNRIEEMKC